MADPRRISGGLGRRAGFARPQCGQYFPDDWRPLLWLARRAGGAGGHADVSAADRAGTGRPVCRRLGFAQHPGCVARHGRGSRRTDCRHRTQADGRIEDKCDESPRLHCVSSYHFCSDCHFQSALDLGAAGAGHSDLRLGVPATGPPAIAGHQAMSITLNLADWLDLLTHFLSLSLLAIGGAITTAPDMHRYLVDQQHWLSDAQFASSIALAQAAPGPNVLFIALLGWNVGMNAGGGAAAAWSWAVLGAMLAMLGIMLPSTTLTVAAARWG